MIVKARPLLCELHAHTTWSDGTFALRELVDLYGSHGFDVLVVTDHVLRGDDPWPAQNPEGSHVHELNYSRYLDAVAARGAAGPSAVRPPRRTRSRADLQRPRARPGRACRRDRPAVVRLDGPRPDRGDVERASGRVRRSSRRIRTATTRELRPDRATRRFWREWRLMGGLIDRFELFNQREVFGWVANAGLPSIASGDFHRLEHLATWKTLLPCEKSEAAVVAYLRSSRPAYITRLDRGPSLAAA